MKVKTIVLVIVLSLVAAVGLCAIIAGFAPGPLGDFIGDVIGGVGDAVGGVGDAVGEVIGGVGDVIGGGSSDPSDSSDSSDTNDKDNTFSPVIYEPIIYTLNAAGDTAQNWSVDLTPQKCVGYSFNIDKRDYFDFVPSGNKYMSTFDVDGGQYYSVCIKSYTSNQIGADIYNLAEYVPIEPISNVVEIKSGYHEYGTVDGVYNDAETGKKCVYKTYFIHTASDTDGLMILTDTKECEILVYKTPFILFDTGYIGIYVDVNNDGSKCVIEDAPASRYFSNNYCGEQLSISVHDGSNNEPYSLQYEIVPDSNYDMFMFDSLNHGTIEISGEGAYAVFNVFNAISEPLTLPQGFEGTVVEDYSLLSVGPIINYGLEYLLDPGNYVFVLSEIYDDVGLYYDIDGADGKSVDVAAGSHFISISEGLPKTVKFTFSEVSSFSTGRFVLYKLNS